MKFIELKTPGTAEMLVLGEGPSPKPGAGEVLIRVAATGVNRPDIFQRMGAYPPPPGASPILGLEVAGTIESLGAGVSTWHIGDPVCALTPGGGYAEFCVAPATNCLPVPKGLTPLEAAALPENHFTVWSNLFERAGLRRGESVLIHGGTSGIGTTAIQLAKAFGATVYATAKNAHKCEACVALGADVAIPYPEQDFVSVINEKTGGKGVDVVLDMVGGDYIPRNLDSLAMDGRIVFIAFLRGSKVAVDFTTIMRKRLTMTGSTLRPQSVEAKALIAQALREKVWPMIENGRVKPMIHRSFPLADAASAHRLMESGEHIGKIMLKVA